MHLLNPPIVHVRARAYTTACTSMHTRMHTQMAFDKLFFKSFPMKQISELRVTHQGEVLKQLNDLNEVSVCVHRYAPVYM